MKNAVVKFYTVIAVFNIDIYVFKLNDCYIELLT